MKFNYIDLIETDSTNRYAGKLIEYKTGKEGVVISAQYQQHGAGQQGNTWESEAGKNLLMSLILEPVFLEVERFFYLSMTVSLAIIDFLKPLLPEIAWTIKWPNDIYAGNKKIAGILIRNDISTTFISHSIAGIGLNVNQLKFSSELPNPVSIAMISGKEYDLTQIKTGLLEKISSRYSDLRKGDFQGIKSNYEKLLFRYKTISLFKDKNEAIFEGKICGVGNDGRLIIDIAEGSKSFDFKEIEYVLSVFE